MWKLGPAQIHQSELSVNWTPTKLTERSLWIRFMFSVRPRTSCRKTVSWLFDHAILEWLFWTNINTYYKINNIMKTKYKYFVDFDAYVLSNPFDLFKYADQLDSQRRTKRQKLYNLCPAWTHQLKRSVNSNLRPDQTLK